MRFLNLLFIVFIANSFYSIAQPKIIKGRVVDSAGEGLPYVHIIISSTSLGTITNSKGQFSLEIPLKYQNKAISISYIGYKKQSLRVSEFEGIKSIVLEKSDFYIDEVFITQENFIRRILRSAFDSIPKNYPDKATGYIGFYKQSLMTSDSIYLNVSEAKIQVFRNPYSRKDNYGQVKILNSKKYQNPHEDTINRVKFYGGAYAFQWLDFVNERSDFINPRKFDNYSYMLLGISRDESSETYVIRFDSKITSKGKLTGKIFIDKKTLAYKYFELEKENQDQDVLDPSPLRRKGHKKMVEYTYFNNTWHLNYGIQESYFINLITKVNLVGQLLYHTMEILPDDSIKPIPYSEQLLYTDFFVDKANPQGQLNWKGESNRLMDDPRFIKQLNSTANIDSFNRRSSSSTHLSKLERVLNIIKKTSASYSISNLSIKAPKVSYNIAFEPDQNYILETNRAIKLNDYYLNLDFRMNYLWSRKFSSFIDVSQSANRNVMNKCWGLGVTYSSRVKSKGRPIYIGYSFALSMAKYGVYTGDFISSSNFRYSGKSFDASKISSYLGCRSIGVNPELGISTPIGKFIQLFISGSYFVELNKERFVFIEENSKSLFNRNANIRMDSRSIKLDIDGVNTTTPRISRDNFFVRVGIIFGININ